MELTCSADLNLSAEDRSLLLGTVRQGVRYAVAHGRAMPVELQDFPAEFSRPRATFVTLKRLGRLRGCTGMIEASRPMIVDAVCNAHSSALLDRRFPPLSLGELQGLTLSVSILTPASPIEFDSEDDLLRKIRPGIDGVILEQGFNRGLFLPVMWKQLPEPSEFLDHLKVKAGWRPGFWAAGIKAFRFTAELVSETGTDD